MNNQRRIEQVLADIDTTVDYLEIWKGRKIQSVFGFPPYGIAESNKMLEALTHELNDLTDKLELLGGAYNENDATN
jgi:hypothetical protein